MCVKLPKTAGTPSVAFVRLAAPVVNTQRQPGLVPSYCEHETREFALAAGPAAGLLHGLIDSSRDHLCLIVFLYSQVFAYVFLIGWKSGYCGEEISS